MASLALFLLEDLKGLESHGEVVGLKPTSVDYIVASVAGENREGLSTNTLRGWNGIIDWALNNEVADDGGVLDSVLDVLAPTSSGDSTASKVSNTSRKIVNVASFLQVLSDDMVKS